MQTYQIVQKARALDRISPKEIIQALCHTFIECHGDRAMADDRAIVAGVGMTDFGPLTVIGIQKGRDLRSNMRRNFGSAGPAGYRKAIRMMDQAQKFNRPILTLINTAGAFCAAESEEKGIGSLIAQSLLTMSQLSVPSIAIILGEGGSGGAIALANTDQVWIMENAVYSILSPEGFASILWKDAKLAPQAAQVMKLTAVELKDLGVVDKIIAESDGHNKALNRDLILHSLVDQIHLGFKDLMGQDPQIRQSIKYQRFRSF